MISAHYLENCLSRTFIFQMLFGPGKGLTLFDIEFFRGRVKVTWVTSVRKRFSLSFLRSIYHIAFIFDFEFTRSKVKVAMVTFVKTIKTFLLIIFRTVYYRGFVFLMPIGIGGEITPFGFEFTRSKGKHAFCFLKLFITPFLYSYADWSWWEYDIWVL